MQRVAEFRTRDDLAALYHLAHLLVSGNQPINFQRAFGHTRAALQRLGCEFAPDHKAIGQRVAAGYAQREGVV